MFEALVRAIQDGVQTVSIGDGFFTRPVFPPPKDAEPNPIEVHTLQAIVDWVEADHDTRMDDYLIHVESPAKVSIVSSLYGVHDQRDVYVVANCHNLFKGTFQFDRFLKLEDFNIGILSLFEDAADRALVLESTGNITESSTVTYLDDGITPAVQTSAGVQRVRSTELPVTVNLKPFRAFREIEQPTSPFVLRIRKNDRGNGMEAGLFEADGGKWQLEAIESIKNWLVAELGRNGVSVPIIG